jgi:hypothetical protein
MPKRLTSSTPSVEEAEHKDKKQQNGDGTTTDGGEGEEEEYEIEKVMDHLMGYYKKVR